MKVEVVVAVAAAAVVVVVVKAVVGIVGFVVIVVVVFEKHLNGRWLQGLKSEGEVAIEKRGGRGWGLERG